LIDLLVDGITLSVPASLRGLGTYVRALVPRLAAQPDFRVHALVANSNSGLPATISAIRVRRRLPSMLQFIEQSLVLPGDIEQCHADVFHSPAIDPPRRSPIPWVQTLLDVTPIAFSHREFVLRQQLWRARGARIRRAAAVIAISRHSADDGIRHLGLDREKVHVIHLGVDAGFTRPAVRVQPEVPYLLLVSGYGPHKGFAEAFAVMSRLADDGLPHHLKVVGGIAPRVQRRLARLAARTGHQDRIHLLGHVTAEDLRRLYSQAALVPITSRYEGFCLPAVEAMASGTPVIAFSNSALPEVVDDGGVLVPDGDVPAFVAAAKRVLTIPQYWDELSDAGVARATCFDWGRSADAHAEVFRSVAALR
jgi:glycosyltransferase involved in cell wall biosynthesis